MTEKPDYDRRQFQSAAVLTPVAGRVSPTESDDAPENNSVADLYMWLLDNGYRIGYHHIVPRCAPLAMFYLWEI